MASSVTKLYSDLLRTFLIKGKAQAIPGIPSEQLQAGLFTQQFSDRLGALRVPHYWAAFVHDGRGPSPGTIGAGKILVWFRNPKDDPRYPGGRYPVKRSEIRHLSKSQFRKWSRINQKIINAYRRRTGKRSLTAADYRSMNLPMIVAKNSPGNRGRVQGTPFFSNAPGGGMNGFKDRMNKVGKQIVSNFIVGDLRKKGLLNMKITRTLHI